MTDVLVRGVPDHMVAALDADAARLGLSRSEYVRRRLAQDAATPGARSACTIWPGRDVPGLDVTA